jgi:hypothetical protein
MMILNLLTRDRKSSDFCRRNHARANSELTWWGNQGFQDLEGTSRGKIGYKKETLRGCPNSPENSGQVLPRDSQYLTC